VKDIITVILFLISISIFSQNSLTVKKINEAKLTELIKNRNGKVLLLNVWATWCPPCIEEFPDINELYLNYSDKIDVVGLSLDYLKDVDKKVIPFLKKNEIKFTIAINDFDKDEELLKFLNPEWSGAIPVTFIYDSNGEQRFFHEGKEEYEFFVEKISPLFKDN
jgi:thiol-disulfide isomerase/thioredoxin